MDDFPILDLKQGRTEAVPPRSLGIIPAGQGGRAQGAPELEENLAAVRRGPLAEDEVSFLRESARAVHRQAKWFM